MNREITVHEEEVTINTVAKNILIQTGIETIVEIDKYFGPLCANAIRVHLDYDSVCWIIERERIVETEKSRTTNDKGITFIDNDITTEWDEVARIDANVWQEREWAK